MHVQIVESDAMLRKSNFIKSIDAEMILFQRAYILFQRAYIADPGNLACIIRDMMANLDQLPERNQVFQRDLYTNISR